MGYFRDDRSRGGRGGGFRRDNFRGGDRGDRQMFDAICSNCGKACQVPFRPTGEKPVYCSDCFEKMGGRDSAGTRPERSGGFGRGNRFERDERPQPQRVDTQFKVQLDTLNAKLDRIVDLLTPKAEKIDVKEVVSTPVEEVKEVKANKTAKVKKVSKKVATS